MATFFVTSSNWNDPSFWSSIAPSGDGHTLDFSALPSNFNIDFASDFSYVEIMEVVDGTPTTYRIGDSDYAGGDEDASFGGATTLSQFSTFVANDGSNTAFGTAGDETFTAGDGDAFFEGGAGSDTLEGGAGADLLFGDEGDDVITGGAGDDFISGGAGDDVITGGAGDDYLEGNDDADTFIVQDGFGNDTIDGGAGGTDDDTIDLSALSGPVTVTYTGDEAGTITDGTDTITFSEIENLILTDDADVVDATADSAGVNIDAGDGNDTVTTGSGGDTIRGEGGDDTIDGGAGDDSLLGGEGDDSITAGAGTNYTDGGAGNDTLVASNSGSGVDTVEGGIGDDSIVGGNGRAVLSGGDGNDTITGGNDFTTADSDTIDGGAGNDYLVSGQTSTPTAGTQANGDIITGGSGHDTIIGGEADDSIDGGTGNDHLTGGGGDDTITTGTGWDRVFFSDGDGNDVITDFDMGDHDSDGFTNDQLDLAGLTDSGGNPVNVNDVVVSDDGSGNALLTFPNGEALVLQGVAPSQVSTNSELRSLGIACFVADTLIATQHGEKPVQDLKVGDLVETLDGALQPIQWIGSRQCSRSYLESHPHHVPIRFETNVLGNHSPLLVSPLHAMLVGPLQGLSQNILVRAKHLAELPGPVRIAYGKREVSYYHLLLPKHSVIFANGCPCESFYPGFEAMQLYEPKQRASLIDVIPLLATKSTAEAYGVRAYPVLRRKDALKKICLKPLGKYGRKALDDLENCRPYDDPHKIRVG